MLSSLLDCYLISMYFSEKEMKSIPLSVTKWTIKYFSVDTLCINSLRKSSTITIYWFSRSLPDGMLVEINLMQVIDSMYVQCPCLSDVSLAFA